MLPLLSGTRMVISALLICTCNASLSLSLCRCRIARAMSNRDSLMLTVCRSMASGSFRYLDISALVDVLLVW